jgi:hypothetical protein
MQAVSGFAEQFAGLDPDLQMRGDGFFIET